MQKFPTIFGGYVLQHIFPFIDDENNSFDRWDFQFLEVLLFPF
jgi:hypothetical protein